MISTSGSTLLPESATDAYLTHLLPHTTLLTPNLPEAMLLAKLSGEDLDGDEKLHGGRRQLAFYLQRMMKGPTEQWILLKGGHAPVEKDGKMVVIDMLTSTFRKDIIEFVSEFSESKNTHGTGCTLACMTRLVCL
jgi:hydroxymethylpyrimidine/phosphomethylpyrimidine kinase